jgi:hypothetical protein
MVAYGCSDSTVGGGIAAVVVGVHYDRRITQHNSHSPSSHDPHISVHFLPLSTTYINSLFHSLIHVHSLSIH